MHSKRRKSYIAITLLLITIQMILSACNFTPEEEEPTPEENAVETAAAQTVEAQGAQNTIQAQSALLTSQAQAAAGPIQTQPPAQEPPPEQQPTGQPPPEQPNAVVLTTSVETNCREGPSPNYPRVGYLPIGQDAVVVGRIPSNTWWLIEHPQRPGEVCWLWGEYTQVNGDVAMVEIVEPPPPPELPPASFVAGFSNIHPCGGTGMAFFEVGNDGGVEFSSMSIVLRDPATNDTISGPEGSNSPFLGSGAGCPPGERSMGPGSVYYVGITLPPFLIVGSPARAIIRLCTEHNASGECVDRNVDFVIP
jgi:hypothetical protein